MPNAPLGVTQLEALAKLKQHGAWYRGCGWRLDSTAPTYTIMMSLVGRGLVKVIFEGGRPTYILER